MNSKPLVSVIIPTYGRASSLNDAILSVLNQTYNNVEILVVDDNDPDSISRKSTEQLMSIYEDDSRVKYIKHGKNLNGSAARNTGITHASGEYICFLDDDDLFLKDKIQAQVNCLQNLDDSWGCCYTKYERYFNGKKYETSDESRYGDLLDFALMRDLFIQAGSNLFVKSSVVKDIGLFDTSFKRNQDLEFLVRILVKYKIAYVDTVGLIINIGKNKKPFDYEATTNEFIKKFEYLINNSEKKKEIYDILHVQVFRYLVANRQISKAFTYKKKYSINLLLIYRYFLYLIMRKKERRCYGFTAR